MMIVGTRLIITCGDFSYFVKSIRDEYKSLFWIWIKYLEKLSNSGCFVRLQNPGTKDVGLKRKE